MAPISKVITRLTPEQYLPSSGNCASKELAWSVSLNVALWIKVHSLNIQLVALNINYLDSRGEQSLLIDQQVQDRNGELLFSNLVKVPIRGPIEQVSLELQYQEPSFDFTLDELFIRVVEPPGGPEMRKTG
ncbi:hypothetical protein [Pleionea litopenaei]|uniref:Uncharacterized protein n=1 Tax=Pleionea litopenaei TaxID=3070815 RepID=A0AA51RTU2_9GAMM|nr:hypothetical protein [Pleionea sp. HL-JVS1]WMS87395.1 hypothetical protein Q9312_00350 [Pleionea sp. HL-JVS1]